VNVTILGVHAQGVAYLFLSRFVLASGHSQWRQTVKRFLALLSSCSLASTIALTPALAETGATTNTSTQPSPADCLVLLFTNPKLHEQECGTSNATPAPPPVSGGDGAGCYVTSIDPFGIDGAQYKSDARTLIACAPPDPCFISGMAAPLRQLTPLFDSVRATENKAWLVTATAC